MNILIEQQKVCNFIFGCIYGLSVLNGVKQGGVLSPVLFAVYIDGLLNQLSKSGVGCNMGNKFMGAVAFADDIKLLTPTFKVLKI